MLRSHVPAALFAALFLLVGCDQSVQSVDYSRVAETKLTGMYCDAKGDREQSCKAGDLVATTEGREHLVCDWGWQIVHKQGSDEILCVHRGPPREARPQDAGTR
ncbi:MAG TPA: hypothetical protein VH814_07350 [Steroidobacteraceae bacterium]|jgi:hypothetical protein